MKTNLAVSLLLGGLALGSVGCDSLTSPNLNFGDLEELQNNPTPSSLASAAQGLMIGTRGYVDDPNDYLVMLGILGRETYNLDNNDPRFEAEMLGADLSASSPAFGGNFWGRPYANIRLAQIILNGLEALPEGAMPAGQQEALRGFTKTFQALDFLTVVNTRDENCGCPITLPEGTDPAPQVSKAEVFSHIETLLDEAASHLQAATTFPHRLSSGFAGFDTPATFLEFNRALRARVAVYQMDFTTALQALEASFIDPAGDLDLGVYHAFGTGSGDQTNGINGNITGESPNIRAHPSIEPDAEQKANGEPDDRLTRKTRTITSTPYQGLCTDQSQFPVCDVGFAMYPELTSPIPIIRNEELILLRAEANIGLGNLAAAETDINTVRQRSGGLPPVSLTSQSQALDQLLYEKRYSLLFEGGHRWIDLRRYGLLDRLPLDKAGHQVNAMYPLPNDETLAR